jgi:hypothetical protein
LEARLDWNHGALARFFKFKQARRHNNVADGTRKVSRKGMSGRYPVLLLCTLSVIGVATSVALLFHYWWFAIVIYVSVGVGLIPLIGGMVRRDGDEE